MNNMLLALPPVLLFGFIGAALTRNRFSARITPAVWIAGIAVISAAHLAAGLASADNARLLTLLPVTAYLPCVVLTFVLSERNVVSNLFVILIGLIASVIVELLLKLCRPPLLSAMTGAGIGADIVMFVIEALVSAALGFTVFRFLRGIFRRKTLLAVKDWYIPASLFLLTGLSLYLSDSTINVSAIVLVLLVNVSVFAVIIGYLNTGAKTRRCAGSGNVPTGRSRPFAPSMRWPSRSWN